MRVQKLNALLWRCLGLTVGAFCTYYIVENFSRGERGVHGPVYVRSADKMRQGVVQADVNEGFIMKPQSPSVSDMAGNNAGVGDMAGIGDMAGVGDMAHVGVQTMSEKLKPSETAAERKRATIEQMPNGDPVKKIILYTYMRGGSSFLASLFLSHPEVYVWYEPLAAFYYQFLLEYGAARNVWFDEEGTILRTLQEEEIDGLVEFLEDLLGCDLQRMYPDALASPFFKLRNYIKSSNICKDVNNARTVEVKKCIGQYSYPECDAKAMDDRLKNGCHIKAAAARQCFNQGMTSCEPDLGSYLNRLKCHTDGTRSSCVHDMEHICRDYRVRAAKVHRLSMQAVEAVIRNIPNVYIVYYVRDPRAIWTSRLSMGSPYNNVTSIKGVCDQMERDHAVYLKIREKYPENIYFLRYEDLARNTTSVAEQLFHSFGEPLLPEVQEHITEITHSDDKTVNNNIQSFYRTDSEQISTAWRGKIPRQAYLNSLKDCENILSLLDYKP